MKTPPIAEIQAQIDQAIELGAQAHINHDAMTELAQGHYMMPQVLTQVSHDMDIMREESFAPVIGIMSVENDSQALEHINDSAYGLSASIWTQDEEVGLALCNDIDTGTVFINRCDYLDPSLPWNGIKDSGRGCSLSYLGYQQLTRPKSIHIKRQA